MSEGSGDQSATAGDVVRLRPRAWGFVAPALPHLVVLVIALVLLVLVDPAPWLAWLLVVSSGLVVGLRLLELRRVLRSGWVVTMDAAGLRWHNTERVLPWSKVMEIRVFIARGGRRLLPHLADRVVLVDAPEADFAARARSRAVDHPILTGQVQGGADLIMAELRRFTDAPVR